MRFGLVSGVSSRVSGVRAKPCYTVMGRSTTLRVGESFG